MNGWIDLRGRGSSPKELTGRGQLKINPAALYELPIIARIFQVLRFVPPNETAFRYAFLDFTVAQSQFQFHRIDLMGNAISLRGQGTARFDKQLTLDFYSFLPRNRFPIPLVDKFLEGLSDGWVGVEVRGKVDAPVGRVIAGKNIDEALKRSEEHTS